MLLLLLLAGGFATPARGQEEIPPLEKLKHLSLEELQQIEVTSVSKRPEKLSATASAIQVITTEDIQRSGATSLPEALRLSSNLEIAQINSRQWAISARGLNTSTANELLVLIDGRSLYSPRVAGVQWDVQDTLLADIDRIEVISGPGASLWGANAVNGVINITSKSARETQGLLVEAGGGTELRDATAIRYGGVLTSNVFFRLYGKYFDRDSTSLPGGGDATNAWRQGLGGLRMDWEASAENLLTLQADLYGANFGQTGTNGSISAGGGNVLGRFTHQISGDSECTLQMYFDRTRRANAASLFDSLNTYDIDFQHRFQLGNRQEMIWGFGYRHYEDDIGNTAFQAYLPSRVSEQLFSGFIQDEITIVPDKLNFTLGTKLEQNHFTGFEYQPSGRLAWLVDQHQTIWTAISRAVRTPALNDRSLYLPGNPPYSNVGGTNFASEELLAYELGYRWQPHRRVAFSIAGFFDDYTGIRSQEMLSPAGPTTVGNGQKGESYGAEATADFHATDWWRLRASFTEIELHLRPRPGSTDTSYGANEAHDPRHQASLRSSVDLPRNIRLDADLRYVSRIANQDLPAYTELDLRLAWQPCPKLELSIIGQNLLHAQHAEFGPPTLRQEIERGVFGKVVWRF